MLRLKLNHVSKRGPWGLHYLQGLAKAASSQVAPFTNMD